MSEERAVLPKTATESRVLLLDYLAPKDFLTIIDESHVTVPQT